MELKNEQDKLIPKQKTEKEQHEPGSIESEETEPASCCQYDATTHPYMATLIVFLAFLIDALLLTVVDPLLPDMLRQIDEHPHLWVSQSFMTHSDALMLGNNTEDLQTKNSVKIAVIVGMKPLLQVFTSVCVGILVEWVGHRTPMLAGCVLNLMTALSFAYLRNFYILLIVRAVQALSGSLTLVGALAFLAASFRDDSDRLKATGIAFSGSAIGSTVGFVMGSALYQFVGMESPFLIIAGLNVIDGVLRLVFLAPTTKSENEKNKSTTENVAKSMKSLLGDYLILAGLAMRFMHSLCLGVNLGAAPAWFLYTLHGQQWTLGVIYGVSTVVLILTQSIASRLINIDIVWAPVFASFLLITAGIATYPLSRNAWEVLGPDITGRIGHAILQVCIAPMMYHLVDLRHGAQYGIISGLLTASNMLGLGVGPTVAGFLLKIISFAWLHWGLAICIFVFSFVSFIWRKDNFCDKRRLDAENVECQ